MTFHIFHHNIGKTGHGFCFHIHNRDNIRVLDPGGELCFTDEPFPVFRIICLNIRVEQFQRTHGFQLGMADQINSAHAPDAEAAFHAIFIDHPPRFKKKIHACSFVFQNQGYQFGRGGSPFITKSRSIFSFRQLNGRSAGAKRIMLRIKADIFSEIAGLILCSSSGS